MQKLSCKKGPPQAVNVERSATQSSKKLEERKQSENPQQHLNLSMLNLF